MTNHTTAITEIKTTVSMEQWPSKEQLTTQTEVVLEKWYNREEER